MCIYRNIEARSCNHCCCRKTINITYSECTFVASVIQHITRMRCVILSVTFRLYHIFPTLSHKRHNILKKKTVTERKMCALIFSTAFVRNISCSKKKSARYDYKCTGLFKMIFGVLTACHTQYNLSYTITYIFFYLIEQRSKFLLHTL